VTIDDFIRRICEEGERAAKANYAGPERADKLRGSLAGFKICRQATMDGLLPAFKDADERAKDAQQRGADNYWELRCRAAEIEWVMNCVSVVLVNSGDKPLVFGQPSARAVATASRVLNGKTVD
jgi:hypothetical protein